MGARRLVLLLLAALAVLGLFPTAAGAQEEEGGGEVIRGVLVDAKGTRESEDDEPIEGVEIIVSTPDGEVVASATTDEDGAWVVELPGPGDYVVELDTDTLPDGVGLEEGRERIETFVRPTQERRINFQLGARERSARSDLDRVPQLIFEGVKLGLIIGITAVGLSLIFGTTGLTNFAHGELVTAGAIITWFINVRGGIHIIPAAILGMICGGALGALNERGLWRPLRRRGMSLTAMMIVSVGLALAARNLLQLIFGGGIEPYSQYAVQSGVDIGPIRAAPRDLWVIAICLIVMLLVAAALQRTRMGKATRAVADNPDLAASSGIDVDRVILYVWVAGGVLATLGGVLFGLGDRVNFQLGFQLLLLMFAGITLGGLGTAYGALVGSFIVGLFINLSTLFIPTELKNVGALFVLILVLLVRPQGILGRAERVG